MSLRSNATSRIKFVRSYQTHEDAAEQRRLTAFGNTVASSCRSACDHGLAYRKQNACGRRLKCIPNSRALAVSAANWPGIVMSPLLSGLLANRGSQEA